jgi:hypothetical protein
LVPVIPALAQYQYDYTRETFTSVTASGFTNAPAVGKCHHRRRLALVSTPRQRHHNGVAVFWHVRQLTGFSFEDLAGSSVLASQDNITATSAGALSLLKEGDPWRGVARRELCFWGRVREYFYIWPEDLSAMLARLGARR